jgi:hypothetical protein
VDALQKTFRREQTMNTCRTFHAALAALLLAVFSVHALDKTINLKIGPVWPKAIRDSEKKTAWDASIEAGISIDRKVGIGGAVNFLWHKVAEEQQLTNNVFRLETQEKIFMWPILGYIAINPLPDLRVHPVIQGQIGFNMMYYSHKEDSVKQSITVEGEDFNGIYIGLIWKAIADARVQIGENSSLFAGLEYQWSRPRQASNKEENIYALLEMRGIGIRLGLMFYY